jgi:LysR family transcriptional regulator, regulator for metE and metH
MTRMSPVIEVRHLALVDAIAEAGSVTRAADRLHLTQSALSHQLRDVEARLGVQLFFRAGRRMVLTPAGTRARAAAARVLADLARTEQDLRAMADGDRGVLRLCTQCNTGYHWLPPLLRTFHASHPDVDVQIQVGATARPVPALLAGDIDLAVMTDEVHDRRFRAAPLFRDELVAIVAPDHPWTAHRSVRPAAFASEHLMLYNADRPTSDAFTRVLGPAGVEPARVSAVPLTEAIVELVAAGLGVGVLARWSVAPALAAGKVAAVRIGPRGVFRTWSAVTLRDRPEPRWLAAFIALVARQAAPARTAAAASGRPRGRGTR